MPRSKSLGRLARILPRIGARWFHVTWMSLDWEKMVGNHMESAMRIGERDIPDGLMFLFCRYCCATEPWRVH